MCSEMNIRVHLSVMNREIQSTVSMFLIFENFDSQTMEVLRDGDGKGTKLFWDHQRMPICDMRELEPVWMGIPRRFFGIGKGIQNHRHEKESSSGASDL